MRPVGRSTSRSRSRSSWTQLLTPSDDGAELQVSGEGVEGWDGGACDHAEQVRMHAACAPDWFERRVFVLLERKSVVSVVGGLLVAAPFLASAGYAVKLAYGCVHVSIPVDTMLGVGIFVFTGVWSFHFRGLVDAVRGAHRVEELVQCEREDLVRKKIEHIKRESKRARRDVSVAGVDTSWADINLQEETHNASLRHEVLIRDLGILYTERQGVDELTWMRRSEYIPGSDELLELETLTFSEQETAFICSHPRFRRCVHSNVTLDQLRKMALESMTLASKETAGAAGSENAPDSPAAEESESDSAKLLAGLPVEVPGLLWQFDDGAGWRDFDEAAQAKLSGSAAKGTTRRQVDVAGEKYEADLGAMTLTKLGADQIYAVRVQVRSPKFTVAFSQSSYTLMAYRVVGAASAILE